MGDGYVETRALGAKRDGYAAQLANEQIDKAGDIDGTLVHTSEAHACDKSAIHQAETLSLPHFANLTNRLLVLVSSQLDIRERSDEITENFRRNHDRVTIAADVFGDFHNHSP